LEIGAVLSGTASAGHGAPCRCQRTARFDEEGLAGGREPDPARETMEQHHAHFPLEVADLLRERRLRHAQPTGGSEEAPFLGDRDEVPQVPELHSGQSLRSEERRVGKEYSSESSDDSRKYSKCNAAKPRSR